MLILQFYESFDFQVASGSLLKNWHAHYRAVTCLVFSDDDSLLISGSEDGSVKVWSLLMYVVFRIPTLNCNCFAVIIAKIV